MRIRIHRQQHAFLLRHPAMDVRQIQSFRMGVNFEKTAALARLPDDAKHVHLIGLTLTDQAPAGMGQD